MAHDDWLEFPDFDVAVWTSQTASISNDSNASWKKPIWTETVEVVELPARAIGPRESGNPWSITQSPTAPRDVMTMLMGGAQGIRLNATGADATWLSGVHLEMVDVYMDADAVSLEAFDLQRLAELGWTGHCVKRIGSIEFEAASEHKEFTEGLSVRLWMVATESEEDCIEALANGLMQLERFNQLLDDSGGDEVNHWQRMVWKCGVGSHVLEGVALLRAMRLVWKKWLESHGHPAASIWIDAVASNEQEPSEYATDRLIPMTASTYAAVIGGADSVETIPHDAGSELASVEGQRWARNIQHLMKEESGLHRVFDPMGGSRVVEAWTASLVEAAWARFEHMKRSMS